ncbi:Guanylate cyclase [Aphelenchoides bicaudatus]|nr:Guanylate cyclase [Aphelenchoides bicaudatus]
MSEKTAQLGYKEVVDSWAQVDIDYTMQQLQQKARIIVLCFDDIAQQREFAIQLQKAKMDTKDYVYLIADVDMQNGNGLNDGLFDEPFWADTNPNKGRTRRASLEDCTTVMKRMHSPNFSDEVVQRMSDWPFYCQHCANPGDKASIYANTLYDSFYLYSTALSRLVNSSASNIQNKVYRDGDLFTRNATGIQFEGLSGTVNLGADGVRNSIYMLSKYADKLGNLKPFVAFVVADGGITPQNASSVFANDSTGIWFSRDGFHPPSVPKCGFDGKGCPIDVFEEYKGYMIAAIVIGIGLFIAILGGLFYILRLKIREQEAQRRLWQLSISQLIKPAKKNPALESARSLQSGPSSTSTKLTLDSVKSNSHYMVYVFNGERVIGQQHQISGIRIDNRDMAEMQTMRNFDHDNLNRFIGLAIEATQSISVWRFCSRGPLCDVLVGANMLTMDAFFIYSLVKDICEGLKFLHSSSITYHGNLKSTNCLLDERWQIKLSDFGLKFLRNHSNQPEEMLWTSPEILRDPLINGTKPGDVYSFGIVCVEILNMKPPWESLETKQPPEDIVYMLRKGGKNPPRPKLDPVASDLSPAFQHLVRDCFAETPSERPKIETIFTLLHSMNTSRSTNLMDHVFQMLESYAGSLESEVEERTKELIEEKKKSDILLYRMLPKQIESRARSEPESYESVTIFFSDIVSFTTLSSRCTPLQVVNLLNDLYTLLDSIIAEFDVYKVETIGDGYLCVSGLPHKNGNEHARHIANMSLSFIRNIKHFTIPHLPGEQIKLRIGLHSGSCVSGVVGLTMPRYCLFGDAINMASRMESNGKANRIHISSETNHLLTRVIGGYLTTSRGEIIVKGKGTVTTYWLLGMEGDPIAEQQMYTEDIQHKPSIIPESEDV